MSLHKSIDDNKGRELTGALWSFVKNEAKKHKCLSLDFGGISVIIEENLESILFGYEQKLKDIKEAKRVKEIAVEANKSTTKSYWVTLASLIISVISMGISIYTLIYK